MIQLAEIHLARERIGSSIQVTPCLRSEILSERCGAEVHLKFETLQRTGSFKARGALNKLLSLSSEDRSRGVIAASAGNHAQGVAFAAASVGAASVIVMPETTPLIKISRTRAWGARVVLSGQDFDEAHETASELQRQEGLTFVHPFDDDQVIAGQGTAGLELLDQVPDVDAVVAPIGGGGLISGIAVAVKESQPAVEVFGVQSQAAPAMKRSYDAGRLTDAELAPSIAEGITVKSPSPRTFALIRRYVDGVELVSESEIEEAIFELMETGKAVTEGAGAAAFAGLLSGRFPALAGKRVAVVLSGANIDLNILNRIIERSLVKHGRLVRLGITLRDRPGSLAALLSLVAQHGANVLRIRHDRAFSDSSFWETEVELTLETRNREHIDDLLEAIRSAGYRGIQELAVRLLPGPIVPP